MEGERREEEGREPPPTTLTTASSSLFSAQSRDVSVRFRSEESDSLPKPWTGSRSVRHPMDLAYLPQSS